VGRPWAAAVACVLLLAAGCSGGSDAGDPLAEAPVTTAAGSGPVVVAGGYQPATVLGTVSDPAIGESSGLAASRRHPGLVWTHNDSGDAPLVFCLDAKAANCGVWRVAGAEAFDWEDMAAGPGPDGNGTFLYLGDIGDNIDQRTEIVVYRIPEPVPAAGPPSTAAAPATTGPAEVIRLRYPDGPHDAEAMAVHPTTGDLYVISKDAQSARVYKAKAPLDPSKVTTLAQMGNIRLGTGPRGLEVVTGADISRDGTRVALSSYAQGYELEVPAGGTFDDVWSARPVPVTLGPRLQGEAIAYRLDGRALLTSSEISPWPLQQVERR
jgi:hypothetical protein